MSVALLAVIVLPYWLEESLNRGEMGEGYRWAFHGTRVSLPFFLTSDSLVIELHGDRYTAHSPTIELRPLSFLKEQKPFFSLWFEKISLQLNPSLWPQSEEDDSSSNWISQIETIQRWLFIPFHSSIVVNELEVALPSDTITANDLRLKNLDWQGLGLVVEAIQLPQTAQSFRLASRMSWSQSDSLNATVNITSISDSLVVRLRAPYHDIRLYNATVTAGSQTPQKTWPTLDQLGIKLVNIQLNLAVQGDEELTNPHHSGTLTFRSGPFFDFSSLQWRGKWSGVGEQINASIEAAGPKKEQIALKLWGNSQAMNAEGKVGGFALEIEQWQLPIDFSLHRAEWVDGQLAAMLTTSHGTEVELAIDSITPLKGSLRLHPTPKEPWASIWTDYQTSYSTGEISGEFNSQLIALKVKLNDVLAYGFEVDTLVTRVNIDTTGLLFWDGRLVRDSVQFPLRGEIRPWHDEIEKELIRFSVEFPENGAAEIYSDLIHTLRARAHQIPMRHLPLGRDNHFLSLFGTADASWNYDMERHQSSGIVRLSTTLDSITSPLRLRTLFSQTGDTLQFDSIKVVQGENALFASAQLVPGAKTRFPGGLLRAEMSASGIDIAPLLSPLVKGGRLRGKLSSTLLYDEDFGLEGELAVDSLLFMGENNIYIEAPKLSLTTDNDKLWIKGRLHNLADATWNSSIDLEAHDLFYPSRKLSMAVTTDGGVEAKLKATAEELETIKGEVSLEGSWGEPGAAITLDTVALRGGFSWKPLQGLSTLQLHSELDKGTLLLQQEHRLPLQTELSINSGVAALSATVENNIKQRLTLEAAYDIEKMELQKAEFGTRQFDFALTNNRSISIENLRGELHENRLSFLSPKLQFRDRIEKGNLTASISQIEGLYTIAPKETHSSIDLSAQIDTLLYINRSIPELSIWNLVQMLPSFLVSKPKPATPVNKVRLSKPINLDLNISERTNSHIAILTNVGDLPLSVDLKVRGTDQNILLDGEIRAPDAGALTLQKDRYDISQAALSWRSQPINRGELDILATRTLPFCKTAAMFDEEERCDVSLVVSGDISTPKLNAHSAGCSEELPFRHAILSLQMGCITTENQQNILGTGLQAIEEIIESAGENFASMLNRQLGMVLLGAPKFSIAQGAQNYLDTREGDLDSSSISGEVPFYLSNDSTLIFNIGYVKSTGVEAVYNDLFRSGLRWQFHNDPNPNGQWPGVYYLDGGAQWRRFLSTSEGFSETDNRLEWSIGLSHEVGFWGDCLFGRCREKRKLEEGDDDEPL